MRRVLAAAYTAAGTLITHLLGRSPVALDFQVQRTEFDVQFKLVRLRLDVASERGDEAAIDVSVSLIAVVDAIWRRVAPGAALGSR